MLSKGYIDRKALHGGGRAEASALAGGRQASVFFGISAQGMAPVALRQTLGGSLARMGVPSWVSPWRWAGVAIHRCPRG